MPKKEEKEEELINVKLRIYSILPSLGERDVVIIETAAMLERDTNATGPLIEPFMDTS